MTVVNYMRLDVFHEKFVTVVPRFHLSLEKRNQKTVVQQFKQKKNEARKLSISTMRSIFNYFDALAWTGEAYLQGQV